MSAAPGLSLVVPAHNEAERLPPTVERLVQFCNDHGSTELVLAVDVQSEDETVVIAEKLATDVPFMRVTEVTSRGKGHAILAGLEAATGEMALMVDCDLAVAPEEFPKLIEVAETGAVAIASRSVPGARRIGEPLLRYAIGRIFNTAVRAAILPRVRDTQCGFKAFRRDTGLELLRQVRTRRWVFDVELIALALKQGVEVIEVPVTWYYRHGSKVQPLRHAVGVGSDLWTVWRHVGRISSGRR